MKYARLTSFIVILEGEYMKYFDELVPDAANMDIGDISTRVELKHRYQYHHNYISNNHQNSISITLSVL